MVYPASKKGKRSRAPKEPWRCPVVPPTVLPTVKAWIDSLPRWQGEDPDLLSPNQARQIYLQEAYSSKFVSDETDPADVRRSRAIQKWLDQELRNSETERRLSSPDCPLLCGVSKDRFLGKWRAYVLDVLGGCVPADRLFGGFSGGATTSKKRTESHPASKYTGKAHITEAATLWFNLVLDRSPLLCEMEQNGVFRATKVAGNVLFTVPKKTDIDRVCAKEPDLNMYLQKGVGSFIRSRLKRKGIDLNDQSRNRELAREGSRKGHLATVDLSSASDSITMRLAEQILPGGLFAIIADLRSPFTFIPDLEAEQECFETMVPGDCDSGTWHENVMVSSMGNGFTFELQSLIFYTLARTVAYFTGTRGKISVYGDDIIIPGTMYPSLLEVFEYVGFRVNDSKSFAEGPFRESCGGHYWNGVEITPFFIRNPLNHITDVILLANQIRKWAGHDGLPILDPEAEAIWKYLASHVPKFLWGGRDLGSKQQLVAPRVPSYRLAPVVKEAKAPPPWGRYAFDLDQRFESTSPLDEWREPEVQEEDVVAYQLRRDKKRKTVTSQLEQIFLSEVAS